MTDLFEGYFDFDGDGHLNSLEMSAAYSFLNSEDEQFDNKPSEWDGVEGYDF